MICKKCESPINTGTKCFQCGYDVSKELLPEQSSAKAKNKRSPMLIFGVSLFAIINIFKIALNIGIISSNRKAVQILLIDIYTNFTKIFVISNHVIYIPFPIHDRLYAVIQIAVILVDMLLLYMCITKLNKRAFWSYIGLTALIAVMQIPGPILTSIAIIPFILKGILLFIIYATDVRRWEKAR